MGKLVAALAGLAILMCSCCFCGLVVAVRSPSTPTARTQVSSGGHTAPTPAAKKAQAPTDTRTTAEKTRHKTGLGTTQALQTARAAVRPFLKYPDDSEFHSYFGDTSVRADHSGLTWWVNSKVKAPNALGAALTVPYEVHLQVNRGGNFDVTYVRLDETIYLDLRDKTETKYQLALSESKWLEQPMAYQGFVANEIYAWIESHGQIPPQATGQSIVEQYVDENGVAGKYLPDDDGFDILFAGPDGKFDTEDDSVLQNGVLEEMLTSGRRESERMVDSEPSEGFAFDLPSVVPPRKPIDFQEQESRLWTSDQGGFTVDAQLLRFDPEADSVQLRRADGQELTVSLKQLSLGDRNYVRGLAREAE